MAAENGKGIEYKGKQVRLLLQRSNGTRSVYHGEVLVISDISITIRSRYGEMITAPLTQTVVEWL